MPFSASPPLHASGSRASRGRHPGVDPIRLLVVDDDLLHARLLKANLDRPGRVECEVVKSAEEALARLARGAVDALVSDVVMPGMDGIELVRRVRELDAALPVILVSAEAALPRAVAGIRAGATDFLQKPLNVSALLALVERALEERPVREQVRAARGRSAPSAERWLAGSDARLERVRAFAGQVARTPYGRALLTGESGTGKSVLARAIHELSGGPGSFVHLNCAALPPQLLEAELFGYEKGAFTDAKALKRGLAEAAEKGTLFLDEIDSLPLELQAKLLVFLESREVRRVGGVHPVPVRTRVVAATSADLRALAREKRFRQDLLYRLDVATVEMPPLREMPGVVPELVGRFLVELCEELGHPAPVLDPASIPALQAYPWPGNARELRNAVERALMFHQGGPLLVRPPAAEPVAAVGANGFAIELGATLEEVERRYIAATLQASPAEFSAVAEVLGISRKTLWEKRKRYGL
jgi:DNA-binding NtrC family response regulator